MDHFAFIAVDRWGDPNTHAIGADKSQAIGRAIEFYDWLSDEGGPKIVGTYPRDGPRRAKWAWLRRHRGFEVERWQLIRPDTDATPDPASSGEGDG